MKELSEVSKDEFFNYINSNSSLSISQRVKGAPIYTYRDRLGNIAAHRDDSAGVQGYWIIKQRGTK